MLGALLIFVLMFAGLFTVGFHTVQSQSPIVTMSDNPVLPSPGVAPTEDLPIEIVKTAPFGSFEGFSFSRIDPQGRPVLGFEIHTAMFGGQRQIMDLIPLYDANLSAEGRFNSGVVTARQGFAVGGIYVVGPGVPRAISIIFVPLENDHVARSGGYTSAWYGQPDGSQPTLLDSNGRLVIGIYGARRMGLTGLGLVVSGH